MGVGDPHELEFRIWFEIGSGNCCCLYVKVPPPAWAIKSAAPKTGSRPPDES